MASDLKYNRTGMVSRFLQTLADEIDIVNNFVWTSIEFE